MLMDSDGDVKRLIVHHYLRAEEHAAAGDFGDDLIAYDLHFKNCDRLVTCEYLSLGRSGFIVPFLLKPTNRQKYEAVVGALEAQGFRSESISLARFSVLVPSAGVVKHALFPKIDALQQRIAWVRQAKEVLYLHYFNEPMPPRPGLAA